jgi:CRP/FNR family transcriptional regulator
MTIFAKSGNCKNCNLCNAKNDILRILNEEEVLILNQNRYEVGYKAGENIIKQGTTASHLILLTTGIAKLYIEGVDNKNIILELILPYQLLGSAGFLSDNRYHYSVTAIEPSTVCFIDVQNIRLLLRKNAEFMEAFIGNISFESNKMFERLISLTQKQMHGRISDVLIYLYKKIYQSETFDLILSRQDIGELSGMTKDSAIRVLKDFESEGIIKVDGKQFKILNKEILQEISNKG